MNTFVVLCALVAAATASPDYGYHGPPAPLAHDGRVVDTPEVAHVKHARLSVLAEETARNLHGHGYAGGNGYSDYDDHHVHHIHVPVIAHGPPAPLGHDGRVVDTVEVAHAKAAHLNAHAQEAAKFGGHYYSADTPAVYAYSPSYNHKYGPAPLGHDGRVIDTPEVAHAKAEHLSAHHAAEFSSYHH